MARTIKNHLVCAIVGALAALAVLTLIALSGGRAIAGPYDLLFQQRNSNDDGTLLRIPTYPATTGPLLFNTSTMLPQWASLGSGLTFSGGVLDVAATPTVFDFSLPASRSLSVSTSYQASNTAKAAVIYPSYACQNATQVLASSACTVQVRIGSSALTCSTGTVYYTQSLSVSLGVLLTQNSTNPVPIFLPIGAHFIMCPVAGTFTITAVEQSAG